MSSANFCLLSSLDLCYLLPAGCCQLSAFHFLLSTVYCLQSAVYSLAVCSLQSDMSVYLLCLMSACCPLFWQLLSSFDCWSSVDSISRDWAFTNNLYYLHQLQRMLSAIFCLLCAVCGPMWIP
jgi:hypothetical protein